MPAGKEVDPHVVSLAVKGALLGYLVGDSVAYPYRDMTAEQIGDLKKIDPTKTHESQESPGVFTNHGSTMLCSLAMLNDCSAADASVLLEKFQAWHVGSSFAPEVESAECVEIDIATSEAIKNFNDSIPAESCTSQGDSALSNACLSRVLPVALYYGPLSVDETIENAIAVCRVTHPCVTSETVSAAYALAVRNLMLRKKEKIFDLLKDYLSFRNLEEHRQEAERIASSSRERMASQNVLDCFWVGWQAYAASGLNFEQAIISAISIGSDTSASAALAGSLVGLSIGAYEIPQRWVDELKLDAESNEEISGFVKTVTKRAVKAISKPQGVQTDA